MESIWMTVGEEMNHLHSNGGSQSYSNMNSAPYQSCIIVKGKPILPPVMDPFLRSEMLKYKEMAISVEKRNRRRLAEKTSTAKNTEVNEVFESQDVSESGGGDWDASLLNSEFQTNDQHHSRWLASCSPSYASTDLAKYMNEEGTRLDVSSPWSGFHEENEQDISTNANLSTLTAECTADNSVNIDESQTSGETLQTPLQTVAEDIIEDESFSSRVRRSSYTLDQPSPALVAFFKGLNIEPDTANSGPKDSASDLEVLLTEDQPERINSDSSSKETSPLDSNWDTKLATQNSESMFTNLFAQHRMEFGFDDELKLENSCQKYLEDLIRKHDEALEQLKKSFINAASNLVTSALNKVEVTNDATPSPSTEVPAITTQPNLIANQISQSDTNISETNLSTPTLDPYVEKILKNSTSKVRPNFHRVSAAVKGYLARRLLKTHKVQAIVKTIKDTLEFAFELHSDTPMSDGCITPQDAELNERLIAQLSSACMEIHDVFFKATIKERMAFIAQDRALLKEKYLKEISLPDGQMNNRKLSSATIKTLDRRRRRNADSRNSMSPRTSRIFKSRSPRDSPLLRERYRRNLESELRSFTASPQLSTSSLYHLEPRSLSAMSEFMSNNQSVRRSLEYSKQPVVRKVRTKRQVVPIRKPFVV